MEITMDLISYLEELGRIRLTDEEKAKTLTDLKSILEYMDKLNELDTSQVEPMAQVLYQAEETATLREDLERTPLDNQAALANAPLSGAGYFKVPLVIDK